MRPIRLGAGGRSPILEFLSTRVLAPTDHCAVIELSTYVFERLREDGELVLYRGRRKDDGSRLLAVKPVSEHPSVRSLEQLEHEYSIRDDLNPDWATRPIALERCDGWIVLLLEDPGGEPLDRFVGEPMGLNRFLRFALGLVTALVKVHRRGLIHKDIKPANILVNSATGAAWLTGFGIASRLPRERQSAEPPEMIAGTLAYMAPEQTGRMNRFIDSRSDLYSLGVTFYEMLTGALPFKASDPTGSKPAGFVHPLAIRAMEGIGIDISGRRSKHLEELQVPPHCQQDDLRLKLPSLE